MEKQENSQLELFSQVNDAQDFSSSGKRHFLERIWNYEKTILVILGFLITGIVAFSLGVEKGKAIASDNQARPPAVMRAQAVFPASAQEITGKGKITRQIEAPVMQQRGSFTIQVASFKAKENALKEAEFIKKRGFSAMLFQKNGYFVLCAGNFPDKETALGLIPGLNKRYGNCQIRRL
ncbi:MAG: SPOR domain-containing protein [Candidatus Omnitrophota bacterium]